MYKERSVYIIYGNVIASISVLKQWSFQQCSIQRLAREQGKVAEPTNM